MRQSVSWFLVAAAVLGITALAHAQDVSCTTTRVGQFLQTHCSDGSRITGSQLGDFFVQHYSAPQPTDDGLGYLRNGIRELERELDLPLDGDGD